MTRKIVFLAIAVAGLGAAGWIGLSWRRTQEAKSQWAAARPALPVWEGRAAELQQRIQAAETKVEAWPPNVAALGELARLYLANGCEKEAEIALRALLRYDPQNPRWPHYLATLLAGYGRLDEAIPLWTRVTRLAPDYVPARLRLAQALLKSNRWDEAEKIFLGVLAQQPAEPYASLGLAQLEIERGGWGRARDRLETTIATNPMFSAAHSLLATVAERLGDAATAARERSTAASLGRFRDLSDPWQDELVADCFDVYRLQVLASTRSATGNGESAIPLLQRALTISPNDARTHRQLGRLYLKLQNYDPAQRELEQAVKLQPGDQAAYIDLVNVFRARKDVGAAIALLNQAIERIPNSDGLQMEMAMALMADGKIEAALPFLDRARELAPDNGATYEELALAYFRLNRPEDAAEALRTGLQRSPDYPALVVMMARYCIQKSDMNGAKTYVARAARLDVTPQAIANLREQFRQRFGENIQ